MRRRATAETRRGRVREAHLVLCLESRPKFPYLTISSTLPQSANPHPDLIGGRRLPRCASCAGGLGEVRRTQSCGCGIRSGQVAARPASRAQGGMRARNRTRAGAQRRKSRGRGRVGPLAEDGKKIRCGTRSGHPRLRKKQSQLQQDILSISLYYAWQQPLIAIHYSFANKHK